MSKKKWNKPQQLIEELHRMSKLESYDRKRLEQIQGYLMYKSWTYKWTILYLKEIHLTINGWREGRDEEGLRERRDPDPVGGQM